ncbi:MAG: hypothetical protein K2P51_03610 [Rhabdochlamydiaceae bacterium]|nr:hypothetical protein [Rhabdochlamydiaceae bacterium]
MKLLKKRTIELIANHTREDRIFALWKRVFTHPKPYSSTKLFEHRKLTVSQTGAKLWL